MMTIFIAKSFFRSLFSPEELSKKNIKYAALSGCEKNEQKKVAWSAHFSVIFQNSMNLWLFMSSSARKLFLASFLNFQFFNFTIFYLHHVNHPKHLALAIPHLTTDFLRLSMLVIAGEFSSNFQQKTTVFFSFKQLNTVKRFDLKNQQTN